MKFKGIQAQLFLAFGCLVLIINLFFTRLSVLFVETSEDIFAYHIAHQEQSHILHYFENFDRFDLFNEQDFQLIFKETSFTKEWVPTNYHESFLKLANSEGTSYYLPFTAENSPAKGLLMHPSAMSTLLAYTEVFSLFLFSVTTAMVVLTVLCTWFLASRLAMPIQLLNKSVKQQIPTQACTIDGTKRQDEIGELASTFEHTYSELQQAWKRERDFTRDVSHELRTPITLLKNTLAINPQIIPQHSERLLIEQATNTLQQTVEVLLALARKENLTFKATPLLPILERALLSIYQIHPEQAFAAEVKIPANYTVMGNEYLIYLLCQNLINNGFYHGGGKGMNIVLHDDVVTFINPITRNEQSPYYQGLGHGQYLVERIASSMNWNTVFEQSNDQYKVLVSIG